MKIGDKVKFLSEIGGGTIAGFKGNNIVLVEDNDGFQIPTPITDIVVTGSGEEYDTNKVISKSAQTTQKQSNARQEKKSPKTDFEEDVTPHIKRSDVNTIRKYIEERKGGDVLNCYLAYVPKEPSSFTTTPFDSYFVNDSNYYVRYALLVAEGAGWTLKSTGEIEPNTKCFIEEIERGNLNEYDRIAFQIIAYKRDKNFMIKPVIDTQIRLDKVKFYKLHAFHENDFFEQDALLYTIVENDKTIRPLVVDAKQLKRELYNSTKEEKNSERDSDSYVRRYDNGKKNKLFSKKHDEDEIVIDLHATSLLETTAGMNSHDILTYQIDTFRKTLEEHKNEKGKRIIFIHGKGEGVLRQAIIHELKYRYKNYPYQDASFQEYGYGATQVTIK